MATVLCFWRGFIHRGTKFMYLRYSRPLIHHPLPNVCKTSYTISASIFVDVPYWPLYSMDKFITCVLPAPSQWFFHFGEEIVIAWTYIGLGRWLFQNLRLPAARLPAFSWRMMWWSTTKCSRFLLSPCDYDLFTKVKEPLRGPGTTQEMNLSVL